RTVDLLRKQQIQAGLELKALETWECAVNAVNHCMLRTNKPLFNRMVSIAYSRSSASTNQSYDIRGVASRFPESALQISSQSAEAVLGRSRYFKIWAPMLRRALSCGRCFDGR